MTGSRTPTAQAGMAATTATAAAPAATPGPSAERCRLSWAASPWCPRAGCPSASPATHHLRRAPAWRGRPCPRLCTLGASSPSWPWPARSAARTLTARLGPPPTTAPPGSTEASPSRSRPGLPAPVPGPDLGARGTAGSAWVTWAATGTPRPRRASARPASPSAPAAARGARWGLPTRTPAASTAGSTPPWRTSARIASAIAGRPSIAPRTATSIAIAACCRGTRRST
mmetsp:Transcript_56779/g.152075  ORF Transcript_56779/g.152075 Transcript_56779/m.152075 type:complete len:228 (+) Transcript_56779:291-974(+)